MHAENYITNWAELTAHIIAQYPNEAGGIITHKGKFIPCSNVALDKTCSFDIAGKEYAKHESKTRAIIHSHPYDPLRPPAVDPRTPSHADLLGQIASDKEWAIVVTEGENVTIPTWFGDYKHRPPLMDREFIHSAQDCLAFVSDWMFLEYKIELPIFPRSPDWFSNGQNHLEEQYAGYGFVETDLAPQRGDVVFFKIGGDVTNHIGVMCDSENVVHHLYDRLPKVERAAKWNKYITRRVRRKGETL